MPIHFDRHSMQGTVLLDDFRKGMNIAVPRTLIEDSECEWIQNMYYDYTSGRLATRYPLKKYSNSAPANIPVKGVYYWNGTLYMECDNNLYYLDSNKDPVLLGALTGSKRPVFLPFNNVLLVASGGQLQKITDTNTLSTITDSPNLSYIIEKHLRVCGTGDSNNPDRVHLSVVNDETTWSGAGYDYYDIGYLDKLEINGIREFSEGFLLIFKRGDKKVSTWYLDLTESAPKARKISETHSAISHYSIIDAVNNLFFLEKRNVVSILGIEAHGKLAVNPHIGFNLASILKATTDAFAIKFTPHAQIWFIPEPGADKIFIYHYLRGAWTIWQFNTRKIYSGFYLEDDEKLYLGCDDGFIYYYATDKLDYTDEDGSYEQIFKSKVFLEPEPKKQRIIKSPIFYYEGLASGTARFKIMDEFGYTTRYNSDEFTIIGSTERLYNLQDIYLWDTQDEGIRGLNFDALTADFTVGETLTGGTSGATATIDRFEKSLTDSTKGTLTLSNISGTFQDNETITDGAGGSATADGVVADNNPTHELYLLPNAALQKKKFDINAVCDNFQIKLEITSGALKIDSFCIDLGISRRQ